MKENERFPLSWELKMPKMGESITEGTIISWLLSEGDSFEEGDVILEVGTDKVDNEVPAPVSGILKKILFQAQDVVPVGEVMAILEVSQLGKSDKAQVDTQNSTVGKSQNNVGSEVSSKKRSEERRVGKECRYG